MKAAAIVIAIGCVVAAQAPAKHGYVQASRAALRAQDSAAAQVVDYLITNTELVIQDRKADWCRVRVTATDQQGFVSCALIGDIQLTHEAVRAKLQQKNLSDRERLDWESRAFWIAPSLVRLVSVGRTLEETLLRGAIRQREIMEEKPYRARNAEFDAMKSRLEKGVTVAHGRVSEPLEEQYFGPLIDARTQLKLPDVRSSFFRGDEPLFAVALRPFSLDKSSHLGAALADALSSVHGVALRVRVLDPVGYYYGGPIGVWDISRVGITFEKEVVIHGVTASGAVAGLGITSISAPVGNQPCSGLSMMVKARPTNARWKSTIVGWVGKAPLREKAAVMARQTGRGSKYDKRVVETIDLDGDSIPDFILWSGVAPRVVEVDTYWMAVFANVGGKWLLLDFNQEADCT